MLTQCHETTSKLEAVQSGVCLPPNYKTRLIVTLSRCDLDTK